MMSLKPIFKLIFLFFLVNSCAPNPPKEVQESFDKQFKNADDISWIMVDDSIWQVFFYQKKFHYKAVDYNTKGQWLSTRVSISESDVPNEYISILKKQFPESTLLQTFQKKTVAGNHYEFEIENHGKLSVLKITAKNRLVVLQNETHKVRNDFVLEND